MAPSAILSADFKVIGWPAISDSFIPIAPLASTPITFILGLMALAATAIPLINPPPPIGTKIISVFGKSSKTSRAIVP